MAADRLRSELAGRGVAVTAVETRPAAAADWMGGALDGAHAVVVVGGDGAVRLVAPAAAARSVPLWHAPTGTENLFARAFGMRADAGAIVGALEAGRMRALDLGQANGEPFVLMASIGFDADVVHELAAVRRGAISHLSYAAPILRVARRWTPPRVRWRVDGEQEELGEGMVVIGNLPNYGVGLNPAASAVPDDGELDAVFLPARSALELAAWVPLLRLGLHQRHPKLRERRGRVIEVDCEPGSRVQLDGDAVHGSDGLVALRATVDPGRLPVLLSAAAARV
jgi:diacylglycerol kinase family enzyme